ncbi:MAG: prenyltransferase [Planctomycetes bacterium]|nr:prenyltransferase [Planctomycetota bacterium]
MFPLAVLLTFLPQAPPVAPPPTASEAVATASDAAWVDPELASACCKAADRGLRWLAARQTDAGCWVGHVGHKMQDDYVLLEQAQTVAQQQRTGHGHLGVTALCGMAFLAGGHLPDRGPYARQVHTIEQYMLRCANESGLVTDSGTRMYSHAFATLFLAELYGMGATPATKVALERAVDLIVDSQNEYGGWRYNAFDREIDLSVTVCQVQALRAARNIGIRVPAATIDRAIAYVQKSRVRQGPDRGLFYYKIYGRGAFDKPREYAINAAALTALSSAGIHEAELSDPVLDFLDAEYARVHRRDGEHYYYWYGNYYAAQAFYQHGGRRLRAFYERLARDLLTAQAPDGRWSNTTGPGDEMATAIACILLQMPRQYLPIFQR